MILVDARVRVRGLLVPLPNLRAEVAGLRMNVMGAGDFMVLEPPPADPYHRKVTECVVTLSVPGQFIFLQEGSNSVFDKVADADFSGRLVRFPGKLVRIELRDMDLPPALLIASEGDAFPVFLPTRCRAAGKDISG
jgi:hypothetical protein